MTVIPQLSFYPRAGDALLMGCGFALWPDAIQTVFCNRLYLTSRSNTALADKP